MSLIQILTRIFNPRECALLTLAITALIIALCFKGIRKSIKELAVIFFSKQLFRIYALMMVYVAAWVYIFYLLEIWEMPLLKDTIKWFLFAASVMFFKVQKFQEGKKEYSKTFREIFAGSTLMEFFTDKFSFSFLTELILIPLATLIALMRLLTQKEQKYAQTDKFLRGVLMIIGFYFLGHIIYTAVIQLHTWVNMDSLKEFLLAPVLSILLLPFIFLLTVHMTYDTQFMVLARKLPNPQLLHYAKQRALLSFGLDQGSLSRWQGRLQFDQINSKEQINASIASLKTTQLIEKHPPIVPYENGWSPYAAKDFLNPVFVTKSYDSRFEDKWITDSNLIYVENNKFSSNYFRYEVLGYAEAATCLELHLTVMAPLEDIDLISPLLAYAKMLYKRAIGMELPAKLKNAIISGRNCKINVQGTKVRLTKEIWPNTLNDCYDITLALYRGKPVDF
jgi:hypothetical protein